MPSFTWKINGESPPYGVKIATGSLNINYNEAGTRGILTFNLIDENKNGDDGEDTPFYLRKLLIGKQIDIYEDDELLYSGMLDEPTMSKIDYNIYNPKIGALIICVDHHKICDRIFVNNSFPKYEISYLVKLIIDTYLIDDGIWYDDDSIKYTGNFISINCPYIYCSVVFDELASLINWQWKIGPDKKFYFDDRTVNRGPALTEFSNYLAESLIIKDDMSHYRNRQIVRNVSAITEILTETANPIPNNNRSYYTRFPINSKPRIFITVFENDPPDEDEIDPKYIGINEISEGMKWYWSKNTNSITQDEDEEFVTSKKVVLKYIGQYNIDIVKENSDAILARQAIEGGSGLYEDIEDGSNIDSLLSGEQKAYSLLKQYCRNARKVNVSSYNHKWESGQLCPVDLRTYEIDDNYLVTNLTIKDKGFKLLRSVTLCSGQNVGGWVKFFKQWMGKSKEYIIREDAQIGTPIITDEPTEWEGEIQTIRLDCLYPGNLVQPSNALLPGTIDTVRTFND